MLSQRLCAELESASCILPLEGRNVCKEQRTGGAFLYQGVEWLC